jgi:hypothetical protein
LADAARVNAATAKATAQAAAEAELAAAGRVAARALALQVAAGALGRPVTPLSYLLECLYERRSAWLAALEAARRAEEAGDEATAEREHNCDNATDLATASSSREQLGRCRLSNFEKLRP